MCGDGNKGLLYSTKYTVLDDKPNIRILLNITVFNWSITERDIMLCLLTTVQKR